MFSFILVRSNSARPLGRSRRPENPRRRGASQAWNACPSVASPFVRYEHDDLSYELRCRLVIGADGPLYLLHNIAQKGRFTGTDRQAKFLAVATAWPAHSD